MIESFSMDTVSQNKIEAIVNYRFMKLNKKQLFKLRTGSIIFLTGLPSHDCRYVDCEHYFAESLGTIEEREMLWRGMKDFKIHRRSFFVFDNISDFEIFEDAYVRGYNMDFIFEKDKEYAVITNN